MRNESPSLSEACRELVMGRRKQYWAIEIGEGAGGEMTVSIVDTVYGKEWSIKPCKAYW